MKSFKNSFTTFAVFTAILSTGFSAFAGDINWAGKYQIESVLIKNTDLSSKESSYLNHHLVLTPSIVAADGITIHSRFDIFNSADYANSQFGEFFGGAGTTTSNKAASGELDSGTLAVTELYMSWNQQFGSLIAGRAPVQFGLGITHNAGNGEFDHWFDRRDMVGYKFVMGNMFFMPMYGKVNEGDPQNDDDIRDYMIQAGYENLDTDLEIGLFVQERKANPAGNDLTTTSPIFNQTATKDGTSNFAVKTYNLYVKKKSGPFAVGIEASMQDGDTGLINGSGQKIELDATAIAAEVSYTPENSKWAWDAKLGSISGDDKNSASTYEGYLVDRNYEVALLMFNYMMGSHSTTNYAIGNENYVDAITNGHSKVDVNQLSNALYLAPGFNWKWSDKWGMKGRFTYAQLAQEQQTGQAKDLGYELDASIYYRPFERFIVQMDAGYLVTGDAFKGDGTLDNDNAYGIITKAAISF